MTYLFKQKQIQKIILGKIKEYHCIQMSLMYSSLVLITLNTLGKMNKEKQYLELIKAQEQIIKELKETNLMYFFVGMSAGILLAHLIFLATTIIK